MRTPNLPELIEGEMRKWCSRCKQFKPAIRFSIDRGARSGLMAACKDCKRVPPDQNKAKCRFIDRVGQEYGRLVVKAFSGYDKWSRRLWLCKCNCGAEKIVCWSELSSGDTKSCGCLSRELLASRPGANALPFGESAFNQFFYSYQKSARERCHTFYLSREEFRKLTDANCFYCGNGPATKYHAAKGTNGSYSGNGVDRIDNTRGYEIGNVRSCCKQCNIAKGVLSEAEFFSWVLRVAGHSAARGARFEFGESGEAR